MAKSKKHTPTGYNNDWRLGHLTLLDDIPAGDPKLGNALATYTNYVDTNRQSRHWIRAVQWIENILFTQGRHYVDDILVSRLSRDTNGELSVIEDVSRNIPRPVNDLLGRYVERNVALLTENRPKPRITPKSDLAEDKDRAELSELTIEYLWEALDMPALHRELARQILHTGIGFLECVHDPTVPRRVAVPTTETVPTTQIPGPGGQVVEAPLRREVTQFDEDGFPKMQSEVQYGDITATVVSAFEMHLPVAHRFNDIDWIMREFYIPKQQLIDKYSPGKRKMNLTKKDGWYLDRLEDIGTTNVRNLPIWWWERLTDIVEGPGPSIYVGTPETWEGYTMVRIFDRKPCPKWPQGRTIMIAGDEVIYDSPKERGARAFDPRWPERWHPYTMYRWEPMIGSIYGRSLVSKLLPKLKRVNAIDTTLIMWRRTYPYATWIAPKGAHPVEDIWNGKPGQVWQYDPRRTAGKAPEPVYPPEYPRTALEERQNQINEMEAIAGTEEILRGQRPTGTTSAVMLDILRKEALAGKSATLQAWDESLEKLGSGMLQEVIKTVRDDPQYAEGIRIIASEKKSRQTIAAFTGTNLSDNIRVRVDTASQALISKEAREAKAIEFMQYAPGLNALPLQLRNAIIEEMNFDKALKPQGPDVDRAERLLGMIRQGDFERVIPYPEDDPYVFLEIFTKALKEDSFYDWNEDQQSILLGLIDQYKQVVQMREQQQMQMQMMMLQMQKGGKGGGGEGQGGPPQ